MRRFQLKLYRIRTYLRALSRVAAAPWRASAREKRRAHLIDRAARLDIDRATARIAKHGEPADHVAAITALRAARHPATDEEVPVADADRARRVLLCEAPGHWRLSGCVAGFGPVDAEDLMERLQKQTDRTDREVTDTDRARARAGAAQVLRHALSRLERNPSEDRMDAERRIIYSALRSVPLPMAGWLKLARWLRDGPAERAARALQIVQNMGGRREAAPTEFVRAAFDYLSRLPVKEAAKLAFDFLQHPVLPDAAVARCLLETSMPPEVVVNALMRDEVARVPEVRIWAMASREAFALAEPYLIISAPVSGDWADIVRARIRWKPDKVREHIEREVAPPLSDEVPELDRELLPDLLAAQDAALREAALRWAVRRGLRPER